MMSARRVKRNIKRLLIPLETALLWLIGPLGLACYWLFHGAAHGARYAGAVFNNLRF